jgi:hypothetical protein
MRSIVRSLGGFAASRIRILAFFALFVGLALASSIAGAATCPFGIPVVTLGPAIDPSGFQWSAPIRPLGDSCLSAIEVDPDDEQTWYAAGFNGVYQTHNGGLTWTKPLNGHVNSQGLRVVPGSPSLVYAGVGTKLFLSRDKGANWNQIGAFPQPIESVFVVRVGTGRIFVGLGWTGSLDPNGIFVSGNLGGAAWQKKLFPGSPKDLIVWDIEANPQTGALYAPCEIGTHPQPYAPPLYRSLDGGMTWMDVAGNLPWHGVAVQIRPADGFVYALLEGPGIFGSATQGVSWTAPAESEGLGVSLLLNPLNPIRLYAGRQKVQLLTGGVFHSSDGGNTVEPIGLKGGTVSDLAFNGATTRLYAAVYASGIYRATIPPGFFP